MAIFFYKERLYNLPYHGATRNAMSGGHMYNSYCRYFMMSLKNTLQESVMEWFG